MIAHSKMKLKLRGNLAFKAWHSWSHFSKRGTPPSSQQSPLSQSPTTWFKGPKSTTSTALNTELSDVSVGVIGLLFNVTDATVIQLGHKILNNFQGANCGLQKCTPAKQFWTLWPFLNENIVVNDNVVCHVVSCLLLSDVWYQCLNYLHLLWTVRINMPICCVYLWYIKLWLQLS